MEALNRPRVVLWVAVVAVAASTIGITVVALGTSPDADVAPTVPPATDESAVVTVPTATSTTVRPSSTTSTTSSTSTTTASTTTASTSSTSSTSTSTTIDPASLLPTLREGDAGPEIVTLQRMLNNATGSQLEPDGLFGPETTEVIRDLQLHVGLEVTGVADHATRTLLIELDAGRSAALPTWPIPSIGNGGADGCQVAVVGDSLMAYSSSIHAGALREINCAPAVDAVGGRSLAWGWQCRVTQPDGRRPLLLVPDAEPGNDTCAPSGLEVLDLMREARALGDIVVNALGTNDAGLFDEARWVRNWNESLGLTGGRPMIFLTAKARPGSTWTGELDRYSAVLRRWCDAHARCHLADWALTPVANARGSYVDSVHLTRAATEARAGFIRDAVAALFEGRPLPNPRPLPTVTPSLPPAPTDTPSTTTTTTTTITTTITTSATTVPNVSTTTSTTSTSSTTPTTTTSTIAAPPSTSSTTTPPDNADAAP